MNRLFVRRFAKMALNAASHHPPGLKTGPVSGQPPPASTETTAALLDAAKNDPMGQHEGGQDRGDKEAGSKVKSEKELEKERKKAEKQKKFDEKKAKVAGSTTTTGAGETSKTKEKKAKAAEQKEEKLSSQYQEPTPPGEKKSKDWQTLLKGHF